MNNSNGISYLKENKRFESEIQNDAFARIEKINHLTTRHLIEMLQNMFDGIDDSFFELANNARTNNEQNTFFEAMREIRIKRKSIENEFQTQLNKAFSTEAVFQDKNSIHAKNAVDFESLSLINKEELEEDVAISSMASKAQSNFQGPILQFQTRISNLYGQTDLNLINAPLNPEDISKAFANACSKLEIDLKERLIVYKQFDRYVLSNLGYVFDEANKYLIKAGILPNFKTEIIKKKHSPRGEQASTPFGSEHTNAQESIQQPGQNILPQLQSLLANIRTHDTKNTNTALSKSASNNHQYIETQDLINLLSAIQQSTVSLTNSAKVIDIHSHLKKEIQQSKTLNKPNPAFKQIDEDLINLVSMLFEFILEDYNLAAPIQVLISRLQIPILKVVIKDNTFFSSNTHPARKLLNTLAKAGIGWSESQNSNQDTLFTKIQETVQTILNDFNGDISLFETLNKNFDDYMIKEEKKSKIVEQRTKESEKGLLKSKQAQKAVDSFLSNLLSDATINLPELIHETLIQGWSRVMFLAYLKDDQEHQWIKTCQITQDLIWCLQPIKSQRDRQHWIAIAPKLLKELKIGLQDVSYHTNNIDSTIIDIRSTLTSTFKRNVFDDELDKSTFKSVNSIATKESLSAVEKQLALNDSALEEYIDLIDNMKIGTWIEFTSLNGKNVRCKLSTILDEADTLIFVNRLGLKSIEKSKDELSNDLYKNKAVILEQGLLIDRAINAMTTSLKQKAKA